MKLVLLIIILFFACGVAMLLIARLQKTQQRLAHLHSKLANNEEKLNQQRLDLDKLAAASQHTASHQTVSPQTASPQGAEGSEGEIKS